MKTINSKGCLCFLVFPEAQPHFVLNSFIVRLLCSSGPVELSVIHEASENMDQIHKIEFSVDLDSVYKTEEGRIVYNLYKVQVQIANRWELVIVVHQSDGHKQEFRSRSFQIKSIRHRRKHVMNASG